MVMRWQPKKERRNERVERLELEREQRFMRRMKHRMLEQYPLPKGQEL